MPLVSVRLSTANLSYPRKQGSKRKLERRPGTANNTSDGKESGWDFGGMGFRDRCSPQGLSQSPSMTLEAGRKIAKKSAVLSQVALLQGLLA